MLTLLCVAAKKCCYADLDRPRIELGTFRVLGECDNQLHHRTIARAQLSVNSANLWLCTLVVVQQKWAAVETRTDEKASNRLLACPALSLHPLVLLTSLLRHPFAALTPRCLLADLRVRLCRGMEPAAGAAVQHASSNGSSAHLQPRSDDTEPCIRVGSLFQAVLPPFAPPVSPPPRPHARSVDDGETADSLFGVASQQQGEAEDVGGRAVWLASRIKQSRTRQRLHNPAPLDAHTAHCCGHPSLIPSALPSAGRLCAPAVDSYLQFVQTLFHKSTVSRSTQSNTHW